MGEQDDDLEYVRDLKRNIIPKERVETMSKPTLS